MATSSGDQRGAKLDRPTVLDQALRIIDRDGLDALTMRRLGQELGVEAMSLYHHVAGKDDLLAGVVDLIVGRIDLPDVDLDWRDWACETMRAYRGVALDHPGVFPLLALRPLMTADALAPVELSLEVLRRAGFDELQALAAFQTLVSYTSGFALEQIADAGGEASRPAIADLDPAEFPRLHELAPLIEPRDIAFERGLDIIICGLEQGRSGE